jgi:phospholipid transport system substrate-binding protein
MNRKMATAMTTKPTAILPVLSRAIFAAGFLLVASVSPQLARADSKAPDTTAATRFVSSLATRAMSVANDSAMASAARETALRELVGEAFDLGYIGRYVLGARWQTLSAAEREAYDQAFGEFIMKLYVGRLARLSDYEFQIGDAEILANATSPDVLVASAATQPGGYSVRLDWRVRTIDGRLRIIDVMVDGVSLAKTQRDDIGSVMQAGDIGTLIAKLRDKSS